LLIREEVCHRIRMTPRSVSGGPAGEGGGQWPSSGYAVRTVGVGKL
jgi:hypothetical protein